MRQKLPPFAPRFLRARRKAKTLSDLAEILGVTPGTASGYARMLRAFGVRVEKFKPGRIRRGA